jgi:hypothetical protein
MTVGELRRLLACYDDADEVLPYDKGVVVQSKRWIPGPLESEGLAQAIEERWPRCDRFTPVPGQCSGLEHDWSGPTVYLVQEQPRSCFGESHAVVGFRQHCSKCGVNADWYTEAYRKDAPVEAVEGDRHAVINRLGRR